MLAYENAINILKHTEEYNILGLSFFNKGYLYKQNEIYDEAYDVFKESLELFQKTENKRYLISAYFEISNTLLQLDAPLDSVMSYSNKALDLANEIEYAPLKYQIISRQGELLSDVDYRTATNYLLAGYNNEPFLQNRNASFLAYTYSYMGMSDSAMYYHRLTKPERIDIQSEVFRYLVEARIFSNGKEYEKAYHAMEKAYSKQDSLFRNKLQQQVYLVDKQFDLTEKEKENAALKASNGRKIIILSVLIIVILTIFLILIIFIGYHKKKQADHTLYLYELQCELRNRQLELEKKKELLLSNFKQRIEFSVQFNQMQQNNTFKNNDLLEIIREQIVLKELEWSYYIDEADKIFEGKLAVLQHDFPDLTMHDMIVIVLMCLGIGVPDSCNLLNVSKNTLYTRRKRIKKRLEVDSELDIVEWLQDFVAPDEEVQ